MEIISSAQNSMVKKLKLLSSKKGRRRFNEFIVEGDKLVKNIPGGWEVVNIFVSEGFYGSSHMESYDKCGVTILKDSVFSSVSDTVTPQGVMAVVKMREFEFSDVLNGKNPFVMLACNLQDPGNLGTLIRTADAAGASGVFVSKDSVDIYSPKTVRATAGSLLNLPVMAGNMDEAIGVLKQEGVRIIATSLKAALSPYDMDLTGPLAIMAGNEAKGLSPEMVRLADASVKLPMAGGAESLNASVASGILMYEVLRQRINEK